MPDPVYLDHLATTPLDPRVLDAMLPYLRGSFGHPGSRSHRLGWEAEAAVEAARARVADLVHADPAEIVFTSGGTEADNLAIHGVATACERKGRHVVTSAVEGRSVLDASRWLAERRNVEVEVVPPDARGRVAPAAIQAALRPDTILVSVQAADAETGTIQESAALGALCAAAGVRFHVDAARSAPWLDLDVRREGIHLLSLTAHAMGGPKGTGALYVRRKDPRVRLEPILHGGEAERGLRPGTQSVAGIVGFGAAADLAHREREARVSRVRGLRDRFEGTILSQVEGVVRHGDPDRRLPNVTSLAFSGVEAEALLMGLPEVAASTGAGCAGADQKPSHVLRAMGVPDALAQQTVRFSLGPSTTSDEIDRALAAVISAVARLRALGAPPPVRPR